jgi:hypothetical protein
MGVAAAVVNAQKNGTERSKAGHIRDIVLVENLSANGDRHRCSIRKNGGGFLQIEKQNQ